MHNPISMLTESKRVKATRGKEYDPTIEAEKAAYRLKSSNAFPKGELYVPSQAIAGCMINSASFSKVGRRSASQYVAAGMRIVPFEIPLGTENYEIDVRSAVVQRQRIVRWRPLVKEWILNFTILYNPEIISANVLKEILQRAGMIVGILDYRPEKKGPFGTFTVLKLEEIN